MEKHMKAEIKSLIQKYPEVGKILENFDIGCTICTLGSCKLEDVVKVHGLSPQLYSQLMYQIEKILYPNREIPKPSDLVNTLKKETSEKKFSPPIQRLVEEHNLIKRLLETIPNIVREIEKSEGVDWEFISDTIGFIRGFADRFHHMKEEDILFDFTDREAEVIKVFLQDHEKGRGFVREISRGLKERKKEVVCLNLENYRTLLIEHIKKEDEILFPFIDRELSTKQVGEIFSRFEEVEKNKKDTEPQKYYDFIHALEHRFKSSIPGVF